ncbi:uncharacterized protein LOC106073268 [Biomphalaria glabrata]|uniref:Uncharacterized protein LOC106073268 n=1 Tax=Biomphalaria glabrata TaxID=6526 RepID=A0A9W3B383_BIOGL|nr:uncharacterized protein LOC106073268 [Biomphalaria glabrata]
MNTYVIRASTNVTPSGHFKHRNMNTHSIKVLDKVHNSNKDDRSVLTATATVRHKRSQKVVPTAEDMQPHRMDRILNRCQQAELLWAPAMEEEGFSVVDNMSMDDGNFQITKLKSQNPYYDSAKHSIDSRKTVWPGRISHGQGDSRDQSYSAHYDDSQHRPTQQFQVSHSLSPNYPNCMDSYCQVPEEELVNNLYFPSSEMNTAEASRQVSWEGREGTPIPLDSGFQMNSAQDHHTNLNEFRRQSNKPTDIAAQAATPCIALCCCCRLAQLSGIGESCCLGLRVNGEHLHLPVHYHETNQVNAEPRMSQAPAEDIGCDEDPYQNTTRKSMAPESGSYPDQSRKSMAPHGEPYLDQSRKSMAPESGSYLDQSRKSMAPHGEPYLDQSRKSMAPQGEPYLDQSRKSMAPQGEPYLDQSRKSMAPQGELYLDQSRKSMAPQGEPYLDQSRKSMAPQGELYLDQSRKSMAPQGEPYLDQSRKSMAPQGEPYLDQSRKSMALHDDQTRNSMVPYGDQTRKSMAHHGDAYHDQIRKCIASQADPYLNQRRKSMAPNGDQTRKSIDPQVDSYQDQNRKSMATYGDLTRKITSPYHDQSRKSMAHPSDHYYDQSRKSMAHPSDHYYDQSRKSMSPHRVNSPQFNDDQYARTRKSMSPDGFSFRDQNSKIMSPQGGSYYDQSKRSMNPPHETGHSPQLDDPYQDRVKKSMTPQNLRFEDDPYQDKARKSVNPNLDQPGYYRKSHAVHQEEFSYADQPRKSRMSRHDDRRSDWNVQEQFLSQGYTEDPGLDSSIQCAMSQDDLKNTGCCLPYIVTSCSLHNGGNQLKCLQEHCNHTANSCYGQREYALHSAGPCKGSNESVCEPRMAQDACNHSYDFSEGAGLVEEYASTKPPDNVKPDEMAKAKIVIKPFCEPKYSTSSSSAGLGQSQSQNGFRVKSYVHGGRVSPKPEPKISAQAPKGTQTSYHCSRTLSRLFSPKITHPHHPNTGRSRNPTSSSRDEQEVDLNQVTIKVSTRQKPIASESQSKNPTRIKVNTKRYHS